MLADQLTEEGIDVILDQYQPAGTSLSRFMTSGLEKADKVIIIGTPDYKKKSKSNEGGAAFEGQIIHITMMDNLDTTKFIPVLRSGSFTTSFSILIKDLKGFDFRDDAKFESELEKLVKGLYGNSTRPPKKEEVQWTTTIKGYVLSGAYIGPLKDGVPNGVGHFIGKNIDYEGEFKDGELNGKGKITYADGDGEEGEFINGQLAQGKVVYPDGRVAEGEFKDGRLYGQGKVVYLDGRIEEGEFIDGLFMGHGKITYPDGRVAEGEFLCRKLYGSGRITYPDGRVEEGEFENGKLINKKE